MYAMHREIAMVDLPDLQIDDLAVVMEVEQRFRAAIIGDTIEAYIAQHKRAHGADVFGLWESKEIDGLKYQQELRSEW